MEGDSLNIINMLNDKTPNTWTIEDSIMEIKSLTTNFEKVIFSHSYCEGNVVTDWIASRAVQRDNMLIWHNDLRSNVNLKSLINYDSTYATEEISSKISNLMIIKSGPMEGCVIIPRPYFNAIII